jgi:hypothetical protein
MPLSHYGSMVLLASLHVAVGLGGILAILARKRAALAWWIAGACLPVYLAAALFPNFTFLGWHGMLHQSYALACVRSVPPEDPLVAGYPLKYGWIGHWIVGHLAVTLHVAPLILIAILDVFMLPLSMLFTALAARRLTSDRVAIGIAGVLGVWGVSIFHGTPLQEIFVTWTPWMKLDPRPIPLDKFFNPNQNQVGVLCSAGALWCVLSALTSEGRIWKWLLALGAFTVIAALIYPMAWSGIGLMIAGGGAAVILGFEARAQWRMIACGAGAALATIPCAPYLWSVGAEKNPWGSMKLGPDVASLAEVLPAVALFALPTLLACWFGRERLKEAWRSRSSVGRYLAGSSVALLLAGLFIRVPTAAEYKFLLQSCAPLACLLGLGLSGVLAERRVLAWPLCATMCLGAGSMLAYRGWWPLAQPLAFDGAYVRMADPSLDKALIWMRGNLPLDAVVISREASVATSAGRSLAMGPDRTGRFSQREVWSGVDDDRAKATPDRELERPKAMRRDGWMINTTTMGVFMLGHPTKFVFARRNIVESVLAADWPIRLDVTMANIEREFHARPVFVLTERSDVVAKLTTCGRFEERYADAGWTILAVR